MGVETAAQSALLINTLSRALAGSNRETLLRLLSAAAGGYRTASQSTVTTIDVEAQEIEQNVSERREALITELKSSLDDIATVVSVADYPAGQRYSARLLDLAADVMAATTERDIVLLEMRFKDTNAALTQVKQNLLRRKRAFWWASALFVGVFVVLTIGYVIAQLITTGTVSASAEAFSMAVVPFVNVPIYVVIWSAIGSCCAVLYRVNRSTDLEREDPLRLLMTQPIVGLVMGTISFLIIQLGFLTLAPESQANTSAVNLATGSQRSVYLFSLLAFVVGFSDRLADSLLRSLAGRFGSDQGGELVSSTPVADGVNAEILRTAIIGEALVGQKSTLRGEGKRQTIASGTATTTTVEHLSPEEPAMTASDEGENDASSDGAVTSDTTVTWDTAQHASLALPAAQSKPRRRRKTASPAVVASELIAGATS